jgi:hypothetical protein
MSTNRPLPFHDLSPLEFERLCLWLVEREGYQRPQQLGEAGSEQGRDVVAYKATDAGEELWYFQCKRYKRIYASTLKKEVDKYNTLAETDPTKRPVGIVFVTSAIPSARVRDKVAAYCEEYGYACDFWARAELDMRVKRYPDIVKEFFYAWTEVSVDLQEAVEHDPPGGTLSPGSKVYIRRDIDARFEKQVLQSGNIIVIRGNVEMGKSSLLASGLAYAEKKRRQIIQIDFQGVARGITDSDSNHTDDLFRNIATSICLNMDKRLRLDPELVRKIWDTLSAQNKLLDFVKDYVLVKFDEPVVLAMDEVNSILNMPLGNDFFRLLKTWQHDIATNKEVWNKLTIVIVFSTEPYLLADDITPLQWTIGTKIEVRHFNQKEIRRLNRQYGNPLSSEELQDLEELLGGHPYLTHTALHELVEGELNSWRELTKLAIDYEYSPFKDHLIRIHALMRKRPELEAALRQIVQEHICSDQELFLRLQAAGLVRLVRRNGQKCNCRCKLYERYFRHYL